MNVLFWAGIVVGFCLVTTIVWVMDIHEMKDSKPCRVGEYKFVSFVQFRKDWLDTFFPNYEELNDDFKLSITKEIEGMYKDLKLPSRATSGSAGYDFHCPSDFVLKPGEALKIPTGIRCEMLKDWVAVGFPRSSLGFKYRLGIANTNCIIDSDFYYSKNEGHIAVKLVNNGDQTVELKQGDKFVQMIFLQYGITNDDNASETRNGGFGSTGK